MNTHCLYCENDVGDDVVNHEMNICRPARMDLITQIRNRTKLYLYIQSSVCPICMSTIENVVDNHNHNLKCFETHIHIVTIAFCKLRKDNRIDSQIDNPENKIPDKIFREAMKLWINDNKLSLIAIIGLGGLATIGLIAFGVAGIAAIGAGAGLVGASATTAGLAAAGGGTGMIGGVGVLAGSATTSAVGITGSFIVIINKIKNHKKYKEYIKMAVYNHNSEVYTDILRTVPIVGEIITAGEFIDLDRHTD